MKKIIGIIFVFFIIIIIILSFIKIGQERSLASQNQKKLKSELINIKINSQTEYNDSSNNYELVCNSDNFKNLKWDTKCFSNLKNFVITAKFKEPIENYTHYCVDSTGTSKTITSAQNDLIINADTLCSQNNNSNTSTKVVNLVLDVREKPKTDSGYILTSDNIKIGKDGEDGMYLRFDKAINGNESLENFEKYLKLENTVIGVSLPELAVKGTDEIPAISESDQTVRDNIKITFLSYENGRLKGILTTKVSEAHYRVIDNNDPKCFTGDIIGVCVKTIPLNMDLTINFEVQVK